MLGLPKCTEYRKRVNRKTFYKLLEINSKLRATFIAQVQSIFWQNKIAPETMNLKPGKTVREIDIFEIKLTGPSVDKKVVSLIDKKIPYYVLFLLEYEGKYQAWTSYKQISAAGKVQVKSYYGTDWMTEPELQLKVIGRDIDQVYENFLRQIAGDALLGKENEPLNDSVARDALRQRLRKKIDVLTRKKNAEKQFNKAVEIRGEIRKLEKELAALD